MLQSLIVPALLLVAQQQNANSYWSRFPRLPKKAATQATVRRIKRTT